ncbi:hypothetical protein PybrP1_003452 [[Pythium] brassicae (nom. inval.)]|nr:hypothetical protein PybrP1_003452 [[Pythium] brassicae (nom. inval.)]
MYHVAVYANVLFYYEHADELPRGVMPLAGCSVKAVDRIFRNSDAADPGDALAEDCGPCWKLTSSAGRVLLFRSRSSEDRQLWIDRVNQANVEHPAYRRRLSGRRGSLDAAQGRRRRTSRLSLDESQRAAAQPPPTMTTLHRHSDASAAMLIGHEVSGMLRDAMQIVKRQKQEILELTRKLHELQAAQQQLQAVAGGAEETAAAKPMRASLGEAERPAAAAETPDKAARRSRGSKDVEIDCIVLGDDEAADAERVVVATVSETRAVMEPARVREDSEAEDAAVATTEAVPPAPHSAPAQLEHAAFSESDNLFARVTTAVADASAALSASVGAGTFSRASYSGGSVETDYLQQQAMELAEIARSLQSSFRTDFPVCIAAVS